MHYISNLPHHEGQSVTLQGWVANKRTGKGLVFIVLRDGSGFCQAVVAEDKLPTPAFEAAWGTTLESAVRITGTVVKDERQMGGYEVQATGFELVSLAEEYPIAKKEHGVEFLMDKRHLWIRSRRQWAILRVRNRLIMAIHNFFQERGFVQTDTPIFTGNACEGTSTLFETDFYGAPAYLSQSGQLYGEALAMAMGRIYTFGPTFRAEKSKTRRHLSEFWMIEPEMAFFDLDMNMDLIEEFLRYVVNDILANCTPELEVLERDIEALKRVDRTFPRITYTQAVRLLKGEEAWEGRNALDLLQSDLEALNADIQSRQAKIDEYEGLIAKGGKKGELNYYRNQADRLKAEVRELEEKAGYIPQWIESARNFQEGNDFGGSDETVLTRLFDCPVMVYNWPKAVKAFYMKRCEDDDNFVKGVDVLAPEGFGEIVGGAQREDNVDLLIERIRHEGLPMEEFEWYLDLRRYGSVPHAGFGLGLERLVAWVCNLHHVRETIPFARFYGRLNP
jgi:asparaginyl-tRNA synthetase